MKIRSSLAGALLLAAPAVALVSGCGGGGSGITTPTPTTTAIPTNTPLPNNDPISNLTFVTESNDRSSFGASQFNAPITVVADGAAYTVGFNEGQQPNGERGISFEIPDASTVTVGKTYDLASSQITVLAALIPPFATAQTFWGGKDYSQGRVVVQSVAGNRFTFALQNVVLARRPESPGSNLGQSQVKVSGTFSTIIPVRAK